jgi:hypothetical protein
MTKRKPKLDINAVLADLVENWTPENDAAIERSTHHHNLSLSKMGTKLSEETKRKKSIALKGRSLSEETRRKIGLRHKNKKHSADTKEKMRKSSNRKEVIIDGVVYGSHSEAAAAFGVNRVTITKRLAEGKELTVAILTKIRNKERDPISEETRQKQSLAKKGKPLPAEHVKKMALSLKGRTVSAETRMKLHLTNKNKGGKAVSVEGVIYPSASEAGRQLGLPQATVSKRVSYTSDKWKDWFFVKQ